jgi:hypothetical protein
MILKDFSPDLLKPDAPQWMEQAKAEAWRTIQQTKTAPTTDTELAAYLQSRYGLHLPNVQCCATHTTPFRAFADSYFARYPVSLWLASRGFGGKSYLLSLLGNTEAEMLAADVTILGGSGEQSQRVIEYLQKWTGDANNTKRRTIYQTGGRVTALMASSRGVRGPHPQRLRIDEADEMTIELFNAAMGQPMGTSSIAKQTTISSTHHYPDGVVTELKKRAAENGWPIYEWCYHETLEPHGWLAEAEIESKRAEVPASMWLAEYDLQEPSPEGRAILTEKITATFDKSLGEFEGRSGEYIEIEKPQPNAHYSTGADWAKEKDWTIIDTFRTDVRPFRRVAWERRGRESWPSMIRRFNERVIRFPGVAHHDATGIGGVVDDYQTVGATGVTLVGQVRADVFADYIVAIENGSIVSPFIRYAEAEHRYCTNSDLTGGGHPPDSFVAGAMAMRGVQFSYSRFPQDYYEEEANQ